MPIKSSLIELPKAKIIRNRIQAKFPKSLVNYIQSDSSVYDTDAGLH